MTPQSGGKDMAISKNFQDEIFFSDRERPLGPIQENPVGEKVTVYCDQQFVIFLKFENPEKYIEDFEHRGHRGLLSQQCKRNDKVLHCIEIEFKRRVPEQGLDYSVITANGELDPRWVPPR
jgi:hypothetical protein